MLKPSECTPCSLFNLSNSFSKPEGTGRTGVMICGEALGHEEAIDSLPFRPFAQAGSKLEEGIRLAGFTRNDFILWNIIGCQPPYNKLVGAWYAESAINHCRVHFNRVFASYNPSIGRQKVILALGNTAFQTLTGTHHSVLDVRGYPFEAKSLTTSTGPITIIGSYHPSYIKRGNGHLIPLLVEDIKKAVNLASGKCLLEKEYKKVAKYRIVGYDEAQSFYNKLKDNPRLVIADDIETPESAGVREDAREDLQSAEIEQIQFATDCNDAIIFPNFDQYYAKIARKILELPNLRLSWNGWNFDYPKIRSNRFMQGVSIDPAKCIDLMWTFKHWQPALPRGLQDVACLAGFPFAWKHLFGADMELYGGADVCSLHFIKEWLVPLMKARGIWSNKDGGGGYTEYCQKLYPILYRASKIEGIPVNDTKRLEVRDKLIGMRDGLDNELQELIPDELKNIEPKRPMILRDEETGKDITHISYGFKREPKEIKEATRIYNLAIERFKETGKRIKSFESYVRTTYGFVLRQFEDYIDNGKGEAEKIKVKRWYRVLEFKASFDQLSRYIRWKKERLLESGDKEKRAIGKIFNVPTDHEGKETTGKKEIEQLFDKSGDVVLQKSLEIRSISTNINNYVPNWKPHGDGCVHTTFGFTAASGQLDSRRPNVLNCSKHTDIGQLFRRIIEAPEGYTFVEFDKKSFHVATMGYCANDPTYIRFSQLDPHSIFASYIMPKEWGKPIDFSMSNGEILERSKWIKKKSKETKGTTGIDLRQDQAKPTVLGNQLELGPKKLYWMNRRSIPGVDEAKRLQGIIADLFPKVEGFKRNVKQIATTQTYLINEFGYIQHFFDVLNYRWNKKLNGGSGGWESYEGGEAREPGAFRVQGCAFGMLKDELFRIIHRFTNLDLLDPNSGRIYFPFRNTIHDSLIFMFHNSHLDTCVPIILEEMRKPSIKLVNEATGVEGLKVDVEYSIGRNWQSFHKHENDNCQKDGRVCKLDENLEGMREIT